MCMVILPASNSVLSWHEIPLRPMYDQRLSLGYLFIRVATTVIRRISYQVITSYY